MSAEKRSVDLEVSSLATRLVQCQKGTAEPQDGRSPNAFMVQIVAVLDWLLLESPPLMDEMMLEQAEWVGLIIFFDITVIITVSRCTYTATVEHEAK